MKPGADLEEARDATVELHTTAGWFDYSREDLEQSRLAGAVSSDYSQHFTRSYIKAHVAERPQRIVRAVGLVGSEQRPESVCKRVAQGFIAHEFRFAWRYPEALADALNF